MFGVSMWEILVVLGLLVVLVGPDRLPGLAKSLGKALGTMRRSVDDIKQQTGLDDELDFLDELRDVGREVSEGMGPQDREPMSDRRAPKKTRQRKGRQRVSGPRKPSGNRRAEAPKEHGKAQSGESSSQATRAGRNAGEESD